MENLLGRVRRRDNPFYSKLKDVLLWLIHINFPAPRLLFKPLYELLVVWRFLRAFILQKAVWVPIFRTRCQKFGKGCVLFNGVPWIEGDLVINIGEYVQIDGNTAFSSGGVYKKPIITIGDRTVIGHRTAMSVCKSIQIGNDCMIAAGCLIADNNGHPIDPAKRLMKLPVDETEIDPVIIGDNVWIGTGTIVLKGVTIGEGSIVAANSLVTRSIPPYSIAMGVPAAVVKSGIGSGGRSALGAAPGDSTSAQMHPNKTSDREQYQSIQDDTTRW